MKKAVILFIITLVIFSADVFAKGKIKIGVYDSRAVALNYFRSEAFQKEMMELRAEHKKAKEKGDTVNVKKMEEKGQLTQRIAHDKGFGTGSVAEILGKFSKELIELGKKEKLIAIVSKWELNFSSADVELVDVTLKVLDVIKAADYVKKMYMEMKGQKPVENAFFLED